MKRKLNLVIMIACVGGAILSIASLHAHYSTVATEYCDLSEMFNCDLVNRSTYARMMGIPVALIGLLGFLFLFVISLLARRSVQILRLGTAGVGLAFALYLAYIEAHVLAVWCLLCLGSLLAIAIITVLSALYLFVGTPKVVAEVE